MYSRYADRHLEATIPTLRPAWQCPLDPLVARHDGSGSSHVRVFLILMNLVATWPIPAEFKGGQEALDKLRYKFTIVRRLHSKRDCIRGMDGLLEKV